MEWSAVVLTCPNSNYTSAYQKELERRRCNNFLSKETTLIVVEDPKSQIGSGGATLNALLVLAEHISAKKGFSVINSDVLEDGRILLIHSGRIMPYEPCGRPFINLASNLRKEMPQPLCILDVIIDLMSTKVALNSPAGVWVCSSDMLLSIEDIIDSRCFSGADACLLMVPSSEEYAREHGICELDEKGEYLQNIHYRCKDRDIVEKCTLPSGSVPLVSGVVYLSLAVANTLLALHTISPLDACTYLGYDSGIAPIQLSLFFDFLLAMCPGCSEEKFVVGGIYGNGKEVLGDQGTSEDDNVSSDFAAFARKVVYEHFSSFKCKTLLAEGSHTYLTWPGHEYVGQILPSAASESLKTEFRRHLFKEDDVIIGDGVGLLNCSLVGGICVGHGSLLQNVSLSGENITIGKNCILSSIEMKNASKIQLDDSLSLVGFFFGQNKDRRRCVVLLGCYDEIMAVETFCNIPFEKFKKRTGITDTDLWIESESRSVYTARLFPVSSLGSCRDDDFIEFIDFLQTHVCNSDVLTRWKNSDRASLEDIFGDLDVESQMELRRSIFHHVSCQIIGKTLICNQPMELQSLYWLACVEGRSQKLLEELDKIGLDNHHCPGISARVLANVANLLAEMADGEGGLRNGPTSNRCWMGAYGLFEKGDVIGGLKMMSRERDNWLDSKTRMVRAARHYEGACQILIRQAVMSVHKFIKTKPSSLLEINRWVVCRCPARIDISGGWSDTPPLTYENGGAVFNAAITVDGRKPIGARARRIPDLELVIHLEGGIKIVGNDLDFLRNHNQPPAAGSLIKSCLIASGLVDYPSQVSLGDQLRSGFGSGFEIESWSNLPHGSGLGTSSIMAGAILACLWRAAGHSFDIHSLNHAVLYVEQLLTTGGGWQDQVGGLSGGIKLGHSRSKLPLEVEVDHVTTSGDIMQLFNSHLVLIYTGQTRLAKNLLQNVIRNWYARDEAIIRIIKDLVSLAHLSRKSFEKGDLVQLGECVTQYWQLKKTLAPGSEPRAVTQIMGALRDCCHGMCMAGAGGGGFMYVLTKEKNDEENIRSILSQLKIENQPEVYEACVDEEGMSMQVEGQEMEFVSFKM